MLFYLSLGLVEQQKLTTKKGQFIFTFLPSSLREQRTYWLALWPLPDPFHQSPWYRMSSFNRKASSSLPPVGLLSPLCPFPSPPPPPTNLSLLLSSTWPCFVLLDWGNQAGARLRANQSQVAAVCFPYCLPCPEALVFLNSEDQTSCDGKIEFLFHYYCSVAPSALQTDHIQILLNSE